MTRRIVTIANLIKALIWVVAGFGSLMLYTYHESEKSQNENINKLTILVEKHDSAISKTTNELTKIESDFNNHLLYTQKEEKPIPVAKKK